MKKALLIVSVLIIAVVSTACINNIAVQELNNKAAEYMQKGDYEEAMNRLQASLDLDATMYETYYNLGVAAINAQKYEKAITALEGGIKVKSDFADFYYSLGLAQANLAEEICTAKNDDTDESEQTVKTEDISPEILIRAKELRTASNENLKKYIGMSPNAPEREEVNALIVENTAFISDENKETVGE